MGRNPKPKNWQDFDIFTQRRGPDLASRLCNLRRQHQEAARLMWVGTLASAFTDDELVILEETGMLSPADVDGLQRAQRPIPRTVT